MKIMALLFHSGQQITSLFGLLVAFLMLTWLLVLISWAALKIGEAILDLKAVCPWFAIRSFDCRTELLMFHNGTTLKPLVIVLSTRPCYCRIFCQGLYFFVPLDQAQKQQTTLQYNDSKFLLWCCCNRRLSIETRRDSSLEFRSHLTPIAFREFKFY